MADLLKLMIHSESEQTKGRRFCELLQKINLRGDRGRSSHSLNRPYHLKCLVFTCEEEGEHYLCTWRDTYHVLSPGEEVEEWEDERVEAAPLWRL